VGLSPVTLLAERAGLVFLIALQTSCAGDPFTDGCERVGDVCAGVPNQPVCEEDFCTQGVACAGVLHADSDASFAAAVAGASPGACIALAPG